jgi:hypothetical protein
MLMNLGRDGTSIKAFYVRALERRDGADQLVALSAGGTEFVE